MVTEHEPASAGAPGLRERNKQEKWERIRQAALALFAEKGFAQATTREIAARAGVGAGTLFLYARTKEELLRRVFADRVEAVQAERFSTLPTEAPLLTQLLHVFEGLFAFYGEDLALSRTLLRELLFFEPQEPHAPGSRGEVGELEQAFLGRLGGLVVQAQARGEVAAEVVPQVATFNFFSAYLLTLMGWLAGALGPGESWRPMLEAALALQLRGLTAGAQAPHTRNPTRRKS
jgi:TetR/AcrR family transcriptional regulator, cholesterol catabolism regulator